MQLHQFYLHLFIVCSHYAATQSSAGARYLISVPLSELRIQHIQLLVFQILGHEWQLS